MSPSYVPYQDSVEEVVKAVASKCQELGVQVPAENRELPQIHATIKMHKDRVKFRYIIGSRNCVTKQVAKKLVQILKLISRINSTGNTVTRYNFTLELKGTGLWTTMRQCWLTWNTSIQHRTLAEFRRSIFQLCTPRSLWKTWKKKNVEKAFKGGNNQYICVTQQDAGWCHQKKTNTFSKDEVFAMWALTQLLRWLTFTYIIMNHPSWKPLPRKIMELLKNSTTPADSSMISPRSITTDTCSNSKKGFTQKSWS